MEGHPLRVEIRDVVKSSTSSLKYQVMRLAVGEDADLLQVHLKVYLF